MLTPEALHANGILVIDESIGADWFSLVVAWMLGSAAGDNVVIPTVCL